MGLESSVGLVVATLDLQLVRLVRAAMNSGGPGGGTGMTHPAPVIEPRRRIQPEPVIEPRRHLQPEPRFEARAVLRSGETRPSCREAIAFAPPTEPVETATHSSSPIEPPWKVLPWEDRPEFAAARPVRKIKVIAARPDIHCKGSLIDLFI